jgi:Flp pilus assembly protein TadG
MVAEDTQRDSGAVLVWMLLMLTVIVGFGAITVDVGRMYVEKRELQNGADAAALGVAADCADGVCTGAVAIAQDLVDRNAKDGRSRVSLCGRGIPGVAACPDAPPGVGVTTTYVRATAQTLDPSNEDPDRLNLFLRPLLDAAGADPSLTARATVAVGAPTDQTVLAITISQCEFLRVGGVIGAGPVPETPIEVRFVEDGTPCVRQSGHALPGGFGWLAGAVQCKVTIEVPSMVPQRPGKNGYNGCLRPLIGQEVLLPIFSDTNNLGGTNGQFVIDGFATFVLTGYSFPGDRFPNGFRCSNGASGSCLTGYFTSALVSTGTIGPASVDYGTRVVALVE